MVTYAELIALLSLIAQIIAVCVSVAALCATVIALCMSVRSGNDNDDDKRK